MNEKDICLELIDRDITQDNMMVSCTYNINANAKTLREIRKAICNVGWSSTFDGLSEGHDIDSTDIKYVKVFVNYINDSSNSTYIFFDINNKLDLVFIASQHNDVTGNTNSIVECITKFCQLT
ncbi:hypothetical protein ACTQ2N_04925 [Ruminococcus sp. LCP21S3_E8]